jgi:hypothetical protein
MTDQYDWRPKHIMFQGNEYEVMDETSTHYVCSSENWKEGYHFITKEKAQVI